MNLQKNASSLSNPMDILEALLPAGRMPASMLRSDQNTQEMQEILADMAACDLARVPARPHFFKANKNGLVSSFGLRPSLAFRSKSRIVHSNIIALDKDYLIVELSADETGLHIVMEKGAKNESTISISLYRGAAAVEFLHIKSRVRKDLGELAPGEYSLICENRPVLNFSLFDENENHNKRRSNNRKD